MASSTWLGSSEPLVQALPELAQMPLALSLIHISVILDENGKICADTTIRSKINSEVSAKMAMEEVLNKVGLKSSEEPVSYTHLVCALLSGGNVDVTMLERIIKHGLTAEGRIASFSTVLPDQPNALATYLAALSHEGVNVLEVYHERSSMKRCV